MDVWHISYLSSQTTDLNTLPLTNSNSNGNSNGNGYLPSWGYILIGIGCLIVFVVVAVVVYKKVIKTQNEDDEKPKVEEVSVSDEVQRIEEDQIDDLNLAME